MIFIEILKLEPFFNKEKIYTLSDYAIELNADKDKIDSKIDIEILDTYTKLCKLDINDVIAVYMLYKNCRCKDNFKQIILNMFNNSNCLPFMRAKKMRYDNIAFLEKYPYIDEKYKEINHNGAIYIKLENNSYLKFDLNAEDMISKEDNLIEDTVDYDKVVQNGCVCSVKSADALTYSCEYYAKKARSGYGNKPSFIKFDSAEKFYNSLGYIDYESLLENENFVFLIDTDDTVIPEKYAPTVDFSELMDPDTVVVRVQNGLADQLFYYMLGQAIEKLSQRQIVYFDLPCNAFNGLELKRFIRKPAKFFSDFISHRLRSSYNRNPSKLMFLQPVNKYNIITHRSRLPEIPNDLSCCLCDDLNQYLNIKLPFSYYWRRIAIDELLTVFNFNLRDYIQFPNFEKEENIALSEKITSCDSVVMHVRLGDYITSKYYCDFTVYVESIKKVMQLTQYKNKKFFIFSDDINWCKTHSAEIGLDQVEDCEIIFCEGNKGEESFIDIQLMALGKILIIGKSGFSRVAAMYSDKWEMFFSTEKNVEKNIHEHFRKNKPETFN